MVEIPTQATRLCLIRHGETEWNTERRIQGQTDIALNAVGEAQARAAGRWLAGLGAARPEVLYSSDLQRAWRTASLIGSALGCTPLPAPELRERRYGVFEGLTYDAAQERFPELYAALEARDPACDFQTGESLSVLFARVTGRLQAIAAAHPAAVVAVVVHGGVLDIVNRFVRGNPLELPRDFLIPNAGLNWLLFDPLATPVWRIESWGETAHLDGLALDELPG